MQEKIESLVKIIKKAYPDATVILFGSRARGDFLKDSDYDLIVVSKAFEGKQFTDRSTEVLKLLFKEGIVEDFEILCYTPKEFERKKRMIGIVREALKEGIIL
ncbi:nucleotidyltransferase domain-containing protein [Pyrococcus kukulkanii]|uniref:nucleotidyltransferase domain-containing protein n=1 Tax=Pyrococcus kukulkanii TaxID=1609559 RepID=UPI00356AE06E